MPFLKKLQASIRRRSCLVNINDLEIIIGERIFFQKLKLKA